MIFTLGSLTLRGMTEHKPSPPLHINRPQGGTSSRAQEEKHRKHRNKLQKKSHSPKPNTRQNIQQYKIYIYIYI